MVQRVIGVLGDSVWWGVCCHMKPDNLAIGHAGINREIIPEDAAGSIIVIRRIALVLCEENNINAASGTLEAHGSCGSVNATWTATKS